MSDVEVQVSGACGRITLNRPRAMNALTLEMVKAMHHALLEWSNMSTVLFVLVDGAGERGLCAGGDIRAMYNAVLAGHRCQATDFFRAEYELNYLISRYPKPYVALMDGVVMGGGIGISAHGSHRVVTERSQLAMPETAIGFIPDVGGTYLLSRVPNELGTYLGLTGSRIGAADAISLQLADMTISSTSLPRLIEHLEGCADAQAVEEILRAVSIEPVPGMTEKRKTWITECFSAATVEEIVVALLRHAVPEANATAVELSRLSPTSLKLTLAALRKGRAYGELGACLRQEFQLAQSCLKGHDFTEGVRAAIVDKDRNPTWSPARLEEVTPGAVQGYFSGAGACDLELAF